jgi:hypothetical protein
VAEVIMWPVNIRGIAPVGAIATRSCSSMSKETKPTWSARWQNVLVTGSANAGYGLQLALYRDVGDNAAGSIYAWGAHATKANRLGVYAKTTSAVVAGPIRNAKS